MSVHVIGIALHPASACERNLRLEEMAYHTARSALDAAGVTRRQLDSLTIGACDELDARPISSMLMSAPSGGYNTDEIKVTDSGASALCLAFARFMAGESNLGLVMSWCKSSKTDVEAVMRLRGGPFFTRPLGINAAISDALFAQAVGANSASVKRKSAGALSMPAPVERRTRAECRIRFPRSQRSTLRRSRRPRCAQCSARHCPTARWRSCWRRRNSCEPIPVASHWRALPASAGRPTRIGSTARG